MLRSVTRSLATPALLAVVVVALSTVSLATGSAAFQRLTLVALVQMIAVIGIYLFSGLTGTFSFGQLGFMAVGAYTTAILTIPASSKAALVSGMPQWLIDAQLPFLPAVLVGALLAAAIAVLLAVPMARMAQLSATLATLAILVAIFVVAGNWAAVTNGSKGLSAIPTGTTGPVLLVIVVLVIFATWQLQNSSFGLRIRATREDAVAARAVGISVGRERGAAFIVSAFVMAIAGGLYAQLQGSLSPEAFYIGPTFLLVAMLVVGGITSLTGAVLGTILVTAFRRVLEEIESGIVIGDMVLSGRPGMTQVCIGLGLLIVLALRPSGLTRGRELTINAFRRHRLPGDVSRGPATDPEPTASAAEGR